MMCLSAKYKDVHRRWCTLCVSELDLELRGELTQDCFNRPVLHELILVVQEANCDRKLARAE